MKEQLSLCEWVRRFEDDCDSRCNALMYRRPDHEIFQEVLGLRNWIKDKCRELQKSNYSWVLNDTVQVDGVQVLREKLDKELNTSLDIILRSIGKDD